MRYSIHLNYDEWFLNFFPFKSLSEFLSNKLITAALNANFQPVLLTLVVTTQIRVRIDKDPELGFSISGGVGGRGNPFRPEDDVSILQ